MENHSDHKVVCFGEVLWDILPSGAVPGGAPMNVAYHLYKLGKNPAVITRIGTDENGDALKEIFAGHGLCTDFFQSDVRHETGIVHANPNEQNEVVYDIVMPVAWDFIETKAGLEALVANTEYFVFGSLASRNSDSAATLFNLLEAAKYRVLDINLRPPHFSITRVEQLLDKADFLKMNGAELELIAGWYGNYSTLEDRVKSLRDRFRIENIVVTLGADGAVIYLNDQFLQHAGFKVEVADTVGSGDAFLAGFLSKMIDGSDMESSLEFASALGAFIATQKGACPQYRMKDVLELIGHRNYSG